LPRHRHRDRLASSLRQMSSVARRVGKDAVLYGISTVVARLASVALLPVYTRYLRPADYGLLQLLELAAEVAAILFVAGTRAGMLRFYYRTNDEAERNSVVSTTFLLEASLALVGGLALFFSAETVWRLMLAGEGTAMMVRISALNFFLGTLHNVPFTYLQAQQRAAAYTTTLLIKLALQIVFNLALLVWLDMGVQGMLLSSVIVNALIGAGTVTWMLRRTGMRPSWAIVKDLRRYGVPYQLTIAGGFVLTFGDRFFLQRYQGATQVGLYALAYQFGFLLHQIGAGPFLRAWIPERHKGHAKPESERNHDTRQGFLFLNLLLVSMATGIAIGARPAIRILTEQSYHSAAMLVPLIVIAYVLHAWVDAVKFGIDVAEKTIYFTYASWAATLIVVAGYVLLIPGFGAFGAALATIIAFMVRFAMTLHWAQRFTPLEYGWPRVIRLLLLAVACSGVALALSPDSIAADMVFAVMAYVGYAGGVWMLILAPPERRAVREIIRSRLAKLRPNPVA